MREISVQLAVVNARPPLQALADVTLHWAGEKIMIRRCAVFKKSGEPAWASLPRLHIQKNNGKTYLPIIELPRELRQRVFDAVRGVPKENTCALSEFPWRLA